MMPSSIYSALICNSKSDFSRNELLKRKEKINLQVQKHAKMRQLLLFEFIFQILR